MPAIRERIRSTHVPDGGTVLDIDKGKMFSLNSSGSVIFRLMEQGASDDKIVEELVRLFGIPTTVARTDLGDFRETLKNHALLTGSGVLVPE